MVDESITRDEFVRSFELVLQAVKDVKKSNETEWTLIHSALQMLQTKLEQANANVVVKIKDEVESRLNKRTWINSIQTP